MLELACIKIPIIMSSPHHGADMNLVLRGFWVRLPEPSWGINFLLSETVESGTAKYHHSQSDCVGTKFYNTCHPKLITGILLSFVPYIY